MLSTAIETLKLDIFKLLKSEKVAEAFANAMLSTFPVEAETNMARSVANDFGRVAADYLAGAVATPLAKAIDKFVKDAGIIITPTTLACPTGPVTGVIKPTDVKII